MNRQFGALSGLAMVLIVLNHSIYFGTVYPEQWGYPQIVGWGHTILTILQSLGWFAVPTFFFISGSFVAYAAQGNPPRLSNKFIISTLKHILIPYITWSIIFFILLYLYFDVAFNIQGYIKNLLVGYPYHFVPLLVFFYLISPILIRISRSHGLILLLIIGLYQLFLINTIYPGTLSINFPNWFYKLTPPVIRSTLADWGIYFPMGLVYGLTANKLMPLSRRFFWWTAGITALFFVLGNLDVLGIIQFPLARFICPFTFMLLLPAIKRNSIPFVLLLERIGRRTYGIYLTHIIVINLILIGIRGITPGLLENYLILIPLLFASGLFVPLYLMELSVKSPIRQYYRYVFG